jgi:LysR family glycine cleavage system transcriptional activator
MARHLPPLNALRTFEVAARHLSFTLAAQELCVTPGAVSRQVAVLEEFLGTRLFQRFHRELALSAAGQRYAESVTAILDRIDVATRAVTAQRSARALHIWSPMAFSMRWLLPRMPSFHAAYPKRDVSLTAYLHEVEFTRVEADLAVRLGKGSWPGVSSRRLISLELVPVCSPRLLERLPLRKPADLARHTLLHSSVIPDHWPMWLAAAGKPRLKPYHAIEYESISLAYEAAIAGTGVAMGQLALVADDLATGRLVAPLGPVLATDRGFHLTWHGSGKPDAALRPFHDWIVQVAADDQRQRAAAHGLTLP